MRSSCITAEIAKVNAAGLSNRRKVNIDPNKISVLGEEINQFVASVAEKPRNFGSWTRRLSMGDSFF